jgi:hypothetical protein
LGISAVVSLVDNRYFWGKTKNVSICPFCCLWRQQQRQQFGFVTVFLAVAGLQLGRGSQEEASSWSRPGSSS